MNSLTEGTERHAKFEAFLRRLCETQAYALAGDARCRLILGEYGFNRWAGFRPMQALAIAELDVARAVPDERCGHVHEAGGLRYTCERPQGHVGNHESCDYRWRNEGAQPA